MDKKKRPAKKRPTKKDGWSAEPSDTELGKCPVDLLAKCEDCMDFYPTSSRHFVCLNVFVLAANEPGTRMSAPTLPGLKCRFYKELVGGRKIKSLEPYSARNMAFVDERIARRFAERR